jgi:hypothetical protein
VLYAAAIKLTVEENAPCNSFVCSRVLALRFVAVFDVLPSLKTHLMTSLMTFKLQLQHA